MLNAEGQRTDKWATGGVGVGVGGGGGIGGRGRFTSSISAQHALTTGSPNRYGPPPPPPPPPPSRSFDAAADGTGLAPARSCSPLNLKINVSASNPRPQSDSSSSSASSYPPPPPLTPGITPRSDTLKSVIRNKLRDFFSIPETNTLILQEKTRALTDFYTSLALEDKTYFVQILAEQYGIDHNLVVHLAGQIAPTASRAKRSEGHVIRVEERLKHALVPRYQHLFTQFSRMDQGVKVLLNFRADVINMLRNPGVHCDSPALQSMNSTLYNLIHLWMSVGSLRLERITWESPCDLLQRICSYEAVQSIRNWADLKRRVGPNRRCFAFTHSCLPRDPVLVVHTALAATASLPHARNIQAIIGTGSRFPLERRTPSINDPDVPAVDLDDVDEDPKTITTAIFYSITSTQKGLQGVELGNHLLKKVIDKLSLEFPRIHQFYSLSPIPGFREWLLLEFNRYIHLLEMGENPGQLLLTDNELTEMSALFQASEHRVFTIVRDLLVQETWIERPHLAAVFMYPVMRLCARYLYIEKKRGYAINAVANFHLRNGGVLWRLNWLADTSSRGILGSCGIMVNYRYYPDEMDTHSVNYVERQIIPAGEQILEFVRQMETSSEELLANEQETNS